MTRAFKEWAVVVDALGRGDQIVILRKGGVAEGAGGFQVEHERFLLFPTQFHQQRDRVVEPAQRSFDELPVASPTTVRMEFVAQVVAWHKVASLTAAQRLRGQHVWRDEVISERFAWGTEAAIFALALRVQRLSRIHEVPLLPAYGGCKSWVELAEDIPTDAAQPVLTEPAFAARLAAFHAALGGAA